MIRNNYKNKLGEYKRKQRKLKKYSKDEPYDWKIKISLYLLELGIERIICTEIEGGFNVNSTSFESGIKERKKSMWYY